MGNYDELLERSCEWRDVLEAKISAFVCDDMLVKFESVAFVFPSREPNPYSFDVPSIDKTALFAWAEEQNLVPTMAPGQDDIEQTGFPQIRFTLKYPRP